MAEQKGILPYTGKLGNRVGYQKGKKHFERAKPASYQPGEESQKSGAEFGAGSKACVLLKNAFAQLILRSFKADLHNRLATKLREVIRTGPIAKKGMRGVFDGNISLLRGFQLHPKVNFYSLCSVDLSSQITAEDLQLRIRAFDWKGKIKAPQNADRVKISMCCVFADFNKGTAASINANQLAIERGRSFSGALLKIEIPKEEELAVMVVLNVFFETGSSNQIRIIENRNFQAGIILDVAHIKNGALVEFVAETLPAEIEKPVIKPDVFWQLEGNKDF